MGSACSKRARQVDVDSLAAGEHPVFMFAVLVWFFW